MRVSQAVQAPSIASKTGCVWADLEKVSVGDSKQAG